MAVAGGGEGIWHRWWNDAAQSRRLALMCFRPLRIAPITTSPTNPLLFCWTRRSTKQRQVTMMSSPSSKSWPPCRNLSQAQTPCVMGMVIISTATRRSRMRLRPTADTASASNAVKRALAKMGSWITLFHVFDSKSARAVACECVIRPKLRRLKRSIWESRYGAAGHRGCRFRTPCCR